MRARQALGLKGEDDRKPLKLRTQDTAIGRILLPLAALALSAVFTFYACETLAASAVQARRDAVALGAAGGVAGGARMGGASAAGTIHVMATSNGSPYLNYQTRIMYKTFELTQAQPGGSHMKYFTRLLHRRTDDELMGEVPTVRVDSLHAECDKWCEFPVADRPNAVAAWLATADAQLGEWLYMIETDYVWMKPLPPPAVGAKPLAFHFHYINPLYPGLNTVIAAMWGGDQTTIPCSGPAPVLIRHGDLVRLMPKWEQHAAYIEANGEAKQKLGWVREMYAYSIAAAEEGVPHEVQEPKTTLLISQPPNDEALGLATAFHYTWGAQFKNSSGGVVWEFDKRPYVDVKHVRRIRDYAPSLPPQDAVAKGYKLQDGKLISEALLQVETQMLTRMREAAALLPNLPDAPGCGWLDSEPACDFGCTQGVLCVPKGHTFKLP